MAEGNHGELILPAPSWRGHLRKDAHRPCQIRRDVGRSIPRSGHRVLREIGDLIGGVSADRSCPCPRLRMDGASFASIAQLVQAIRDFTAVYNRNAAPFVWRKREVKGAQLRNTIVNLDFSDEQELLLFAPS